MASSPNPPPLPKKTNRTRVGCSCAVPTETMDAWDRLFHDADANAGDVCVSGDEKSQSILAHSSILRVSSPVLANLVNPIKRAKNGTRCVLHIRIPGVPFDAVRVFIRFLYSSRYEKEEMNKFGVHLLVLSHSYSVPSLKRACSNFLERRWLTNENVVDLVQLARECDSPRLSLICVRKIVADFKAVSVTQGWKAMKRANPALEQELIEFVVEADSKKHERVRRKEERKVYLELGEAMEALVHICRDGCRTIGPSDKALKGGQSSCGFPACKGVEALVRHFSSCKTRAPGGCSHCKRMWQLLELHSRMCNRLGDSCKVPLCRHFKGKMRRQSKKEETKWKVLAAKVVAAKNAVALGAFSAYFMS